MPSYAVYKGRVPGVYANWEDCWIQVHHFSSCIYKRYNTLAEAEARYSHFLAGERREMRRNQMKTTFILMLLIMIAFLIYVILV